MIIAWAALLVGGVGLTLFSAHHSLDAARGLAQALGLSPFFIGMTVMAIGTDLPEIANSITASATGHGDINVGDSIGSVVTQITLVLGLLCLFGGMKGDRHFLRVAGPVTVGSVLLGALLLTDEMLSRLDGALLIGFWLAGTILVRRRGHLVEPRQETLFSRSTLTDGRNLTLGLAGVAAGAIAAVTAFTNLAEALDVPEYATSFLLLSLGTSLPELAVDFQALRKGESAMALGDIVGSCFVDATLSLGIGPLLFPVAVGSAAAQGSLIAAAVVALALATLLRTAPHGRRTGLILLVLYAATVPLIAL